ncbi:hypothetical protein P280DRAFT_466300 [Massarina eburnea CBS 473.64]|uniref:Uncharacterized protein n=1 Tax=Massarina eburnea CBS 473.64 TaxID=1395130 RepID=A0A6A6SBX6_9PLEO|nr:hypothetical protein P280DRAFT_466300 [Massarina eburnea CBS 473.64]
MTIMRFLCALALLLIPTYADLSAHANGSIAINATSHKISKRAISNEDWMRFQAQGCNLLGAMAVKDETAAMFVNYGSMTTAASPFHDYGMSIRTVSSVWLSPSTARVSTHG